jgi:hypothetical protein
MGWKKNNLGGSGGSGGSGGEVYTQVNTYADLPLPTTVPDKTFVVLTGTGIYIVNRKESGLYYSDGVNWRRLGNTPDFFKDSNFQVYNATDSTKALKVDASNLPTGAIRVIKAPSQSGEMATYPLGNGNGRFYYKISANNKWSLWEKVSPTEDKLVTEFGSVITDEFTATEPMGGLSSKLTWLPEQYNLVRNSPTGTGKSVVAGNYASKTYIASDLNGSFSSYETGVTFEEDRTITPVTQKSGTRHEFAIRNESVPYGMCYSVTVNCYTTLQKVLVRRAMYDQNGHIMHQTITDQEWDSQNDDAWLVAHGAEYVDFTKGMNAIETSIPFPTEGEVSYTYIFQTRAPISIDYNTNGSIPSYTIQFEEISVERIATREWLALNDVTGMGHTLPTSMGTTHIEGRNNIVLANVARSHVEGSNNTANASVVHVEGIGNNAGATTPQGAHIGGSYANPSGTGQIETIGIGTGSTVLKDGRVLYSDGTETLPSSTPTLIGMRGSKAVMTVECMKGFPSLGGENVFTGGNSFAKLPTTNAINTPTQPGEFIHKKALDDAISSIEIDMTDVVSKTKDNTISGLNTFTKLPTIATSSVIGSRGAGQGIIYRIDPATGEYYECLAIYKSTTKAWSQANTKMMVDISTDSWTLTKAIVDQVGSGDCVAKYVYNTPINGKLDWAMPSINEFSAMALCPALVADIADQWYWASSSDQMELQAIAIKLSTKERKYEAKQTALLGLVIRKGVNALPSPIGDGDLTTKQYVDNAVSNVTPVGSFIPMEGDCLVGGIKTFKEPVCMDVSATPRNVGDKTPYGSYVYFSNQYGYAEIMFEPIAGAIWSNDESNKCGTDGKVSAEVSNHFMRSTGYSASGIAYNVQNFECVPGPTGRGWNVPTIDDFTRAMVAGFIPSNLPQRAIWTSSEAVGTDPGQAMGIEIVAGALGQPKSYCKWEEFSYYPIRRITNPSLRIANPAQMPTMDMVIKTIQDTPVVGSENDSVIRGNKEFTALPSLKSLCGSYKVGEKTAYGGTVFYADDFSYKEFIIAPETADNPPWSNVTSGDAGCTNAISSIQSTEKMIFQTSANKGVAFDARRYRGGGSDTWVVPNTSDMSLILNAPVPSITDGWYWTSTEFSNTQAYALHIDEASNNLVEITAQSKSAKLRRIYMRDSLLPFDIPMKPNHLTTKEYVDACTALSNVSRKTFDSQTFYIPHGYKYSPSVVDGCNKVTELMYVVFSNLDGAPVTNNDEFSLTIWAGGKSIMKLQPNKPEGAVFEYRTLFHTNAQDIFYIVSDGDALLNFNISITRCFSR